MNERLFHLSGTESLEDIIELICNTKVDDIYLLFPRKSWIFSQITDLHSLRDRVELLGKNLTVVTANSTARQTLQSMGIGAIALLEEKEKTPFEKMKDDRSDDSREIKNITVDPLIYEKKGKQKERHLKNLEKKQKSFFSRPSLHALVLLGTIAVILFLFILNVAIPDAILQITPAKKEEELHININLLSKRVFEESELWRVNHGVFSIPLEKVFRVEMVYTQVTKKFLGENASGKIRIQNPFNESYTFQKGTRFETKNGVIFITSRWISIPAKGEKIFDAQAKETDNYEKFQGERANIPKGQQMFIPGLPERVREKFTVENITPMTGGKTQWVREVTHQDLQKSAKQAEKLARNQVKQELEYLLQKENTKNSGDLLLLPFSTKQLEFEVISTEFSESEDDLLGKEINDFRVVVTARTRNFAYSQSELLTAMEEKFKKSAPEGMSLLSLDSNVLVPEIQDIKEDANRIKVSFSTRGVYQFVIEPKSDDGYRFTNRAKKSIAGMRVKDAKIELVNNFPEVSDVEIQVWPVWLRRLPVLEENIRFEIGES